MQKNSHRFWEIDFLRGVAIIMMVVFHFLYDLNYFGFIDLNVFKDFWGIFGKTTFTLFLLLVGVSLSLSASRRQKNGTFKFKIYLKRGLKVFLWGMAITLVTYLVIPEAYVRFGVLHLIGVSIILSFPFLRFRYLNLFVGIGIILLGFYFLTLTIESPLLFWLGLTPSIFNSVDYFPIFPYWGTILLGLFVGKSLYNNFVRTFEFPSTGDYPVVSQISFLGRHSLLIYLIHQPLLIILLYMV